MGFLVVVNSSIFEKSVHPGSALNLICVSKSFIKFFSLWNKRSRLCDVLSTTHKFWQCTNEHRNMYFDVMAVELRQAVLMKDALTLFRVPLPQRNINILGWVYFFRFTFKKRENLAHKGMSLTCEHEWKLLSHWDFDFRKFWEVMLSNQGCLLKLKTDHFSKITSTLAYSNS